MADVLPDFDKLPSISVLDTATLPDFDDATASNLSKKKKKRKKKKSSCSPSSKSKSKKAKSSKSKSHSKSKSKSAYPTPKTNPQPTQVKPKRRNAMKYDKITRESDEEGKAPNSPRITPKTPKGVKIYTNKNDKDEDNDKTNKSKKRKSNERTNKFKSKSKPKKEDSKFGLPISAELHVFSYTKQKNYTH